MNEIAVVGMSCRFPGARNTDEYWRNLCGAVESISFFSKEALLEAGVSPELVHDPSYVPAHGSLPEAYAFDAAFFAVSPREAQIMDPQHRVFLECAWSALEDAACDPQRYPGAIGVFAGSGSTSYWMRILANSDLVSAVGPEAVHIGNAKDYLTTRASYKLALKGPSVTIQTACSTSLVAIHVACQSLLNRECDIALAGGVTISADQVLGYRHQEGGIRSSDGHCRAFDAHATGTVGASGAGVVALKRLDEAIRDRDTIYAVVKGSAINNDGADKIGFSAPSIAGQARAIAEALAVADVDPSSIGYVETHGTGTPLGDPIEIAALIEAFRGSTDRKAFCALGAVKTNVGHLDTAAGVAGFIKAVLSLKHRLIPPTLHFENPNPELGLEDSPFYVNAALQNWHRNGTPLRCGVSSFGIGGTNAHLVLEEPPEPPATPASIRPELLILSAKSEPALARMRESLAGHLASHADVSLADVAHTLQVGRSAHPFRWAAVAGNIDCARSALIAGDAESIVSRRAHDRPPAVAFLFPGQGTQYAGMARELYECEPVFQFELDRCAQAVGPKLEIDLRRVLFPASGGEVEANGLLQQTRYTQPALFAVEYALAKLWMSWGVQPDGMLGHSVGEYVAACIAGVFSLDDALTLIEARGRLMQELPAGAMLAVPLSEQEIVAWMPQSLSLAAVNSAVNCVVSGGIADIEQIETFLSRQDQVSRRLRTSHAFHSAMMDPILKPFADVVSKLQLGAPRIPFLSNVTGNWIEKEQATDPRYWVRHLRETVRFADGVRRLLETSDRLLL